MSGIFPACAVPGHRSDESHIGTSTAAVVGGTYDDNSGGTALFPATGLLVMNTHDNQSSSCSATLVACGLVITAAHCTINGAGEYFPGSFTTDSRSGDCGSTVDGHGADASGRIARHPSYKWFPGPSPDASDRHDVALVELGTVGDVTIASGLFKMWGHATLPEVGAPELIAEDIQLIQVGYGGSLYADICGSGKFSLRRRYADVFVTQPPGQLFRFLGLDGEVTGEEGDSGGPLFLPDGKTIVGIDSGATQLDAFAANITDTPDSNSSNWAWLHDSLPALGTITAWDKDGDGIPDACDACDLPDDGTDIDEDDISDACDNCPGPNPDQKDSDHDGVGDVCDSCKDGPPGTTHADQYDADGDGVGDVCDDCPCDPDVKVDPDGDGLCDVCRTDLQSIGLDSQNRCATTICPGSVKDTCPGIRDLGTNCNSDAEQAMNARILGDGCDPVPCPAFDSEPKAEQTLSATTFGGAWGLVGVSRVVASKTGRLEITTLGQFDSPEKYAQTQPPPLSGNTEVPATVDGTEFRYCFDSQDVNCHQLTDHFESGLTATADRCHEQFDSGWHRIWVGGDDTSGAIFPPACSGAPSQLNPVDTHINPYATPNPTNPAYPASAFVRTWNWEDDFGFWSTSPPVQPIFPSGVPTSANQGAGRLWLHARTNLGMASNSTNAHHGIHGRADDFNTPQVGLANAFQNVSPLTDAKTYIEVHVVNTSPPVNLDITAKPCVSCRIRELVPELSWNLVSHPDWGYPVTQVPDSSPYQAQQIVTIPGLEAHPGVLLNDGRLVDVSAYMGDGLRASLSLGLRWVSAVETRPDAGIGARGPSTVGLSADGTTMVERAYLAGGGMFGNADMAIGPRDALDPPSPRKDFEAVYSRSTQQIFVVGGEDLSTHQLLGDVWLGDVRTREWTQVSLVGYQVGRVLAATYSPRDRRLWILDEIAGQYGMKRARLSRMKPGTGEVEIVGTWPRIGLFDKLWLVIDQDNTVLLAASSEKIHKHVVVHIDNASQPYVDRIYVGQHPLVLAPLVDADGYAFTRQVNKHKMPTTVRMRALGNGHGHWEELAQCL